MSGSNSVAMGSQEKTFGKGWDEQGRDLTVLYVIMSAPESAKNLMRFAVVVRTDADAPNGELTSRPRNVVGIGCSELERVRGKIDGSLTILFW